MNKRSGLKNIHVQFSEIFTKLDATFAKAKEVSNYKVMGGIVGIWTKMLLDSLLRNRLVKEGVSCIPVHPLVTNYFGLLQVSYRG